MELIYLLTGLALTLFASGVAALIWSIRSGQMDDLDTPAVRLLLDEPAHALPIQQPTQQPIQPTRTP